MNSSHVESDWSAARGSGRRLAVAVALALALVLAACERGAPTEAPPPAYARVVPCGGVTQVQTPDSSEWVTLDTQVAVRSEVRLAAKGESGRVCFGDRSILELAPGSAADLRPVEGEARIEIVPREGSWTLLAYDTSYQVSTSACPVVVSDVPARLRVAQEGEGARVRVAQGEATCATGSEPTLLPTCWELVAAPGGEPEIGQYCAEGDATPTPSPTPTVPSASPTPSPTEAAATALPGSPTPEPATPTPEPTPIP